MADIAKVHARSVEGFQAAYTDELAAYQRASLSNDIDEMARAAQQMAGLRATMKELDAMASEVYRASVPPPDASRYGLNADEREIARGMFSGDQRLSNDDRERLYAENKAKYQYMRSTGQYDDSQGKVRR